VIYNSGCWSVTFNGLYGATDSIRIYLRGELDDRKTYLDHPVESQLDYRGFPTWQ